MMDNKIELISRKAVRNMISALLQDVKDYAVSDQDEGTIAEKYILARVLTLIDSAETLAVLPVREVSQ